MTQLGLVAPNVEHAPPSGALGPEWVEMTAEERAKSSRSMEAFAAMVELIDTNFGQVVDHLKASREFENTFTLFMSDNGAEGAALEAISLMGGETTFAKIIEECYDNSLDNIGEPTSFACPAFTTVVDILPTCLELAGIASPSSTFRGREVVPVRGKPWVSHLSSRDHAARSVHGEDTHIHGWELFGQRAIREGRWKAIWIGKPKGKGDWELYDVERDPAEMRDLADGETDVLSQLKSLWERYLAKTGIVQTPMFEGEKAWS